MKLALSTTFAASLLLAATALVHPARADIFQTAIGANSPAGGFVIQGDGTTANSNIIGAAFNLTQTTNIGGIGGNFVVSNGASSGSIFGEIVKLSSLTSFPSVPVEGLASIALGEVTFTPTANGDDIGALTLQLQPGTYGLILGSGLFGATGFATLSSGNTPTDANPLFEDQFGSGLPSDNFFDPFGPADARLFLVPEPATIAMFGIGLAMLGVARRRSV